MKQESKASSSGKAGTFQLFPSSAQVLALQRYMLNPNLTQLPDLKLQTLTGQKAIPTEYPFRIYEINNKLSLVPPEDDNKSLRSSVLAEITKDSDRNYIITTEATAYIDSNPLLPGSKLTHGCKLSFSGKYYSRDGGHIIICTFSRDYILEKGLDVSHLAKNQSQSVFLPKRMTNYSLLVPMEARIIPSKWNFEERDHLK